MRPLALLVLATLPGCRVTGAFQCETSDQCRLGAVTGFCESTGYCSFLDVECASGHRYDDSAGELAQACVDGVRARRKTITIDGTKVAGTVTSFPVWIDITDPEIAGRAALDGSDIEFTAGDGTPLSYEIQRWDAATGRLNAWVSVPQLDAGTNTAIEIRYGAPRVSSPAPGRVFDNGFVAVWHLDDSLATPAIADATGTSAGTATGGLAASDQVAARLGGGLELDGVANAVQFGNPFAGGTSHTISAWIDARTQTTYGSIVTVGNPENGRSRWLHARFSTGSVAVGFWGNDWTDTGAIVEGAGFTLLHWVFDSTTRTSHLYRDGALVSMHVHSIGISTQGTTGHLGNAPNDWGINGMNPVPFTGILDEVRLATVARSAAWIATEYANQHSPSTFYSVGEEALVP